MKAFQFEKTSVLISTLLKVLIINSKSGIFYLVFILAFPLFLKSQLANLTHPGYRHFTAEDGLPSSEVYKIIQDHQGFLWFATDNGISRYNGYKFENFGVLQGLTDLLVYLLQEDRQGRIWMQCKSGKLFYFENDSIYAFAGNKLMGDLKNKQDAAECLIIDSIGQIYSSILPIGLFRFSANGNYTQIIKDIGFAAYQVEKKAIDVITRNFTDNRGMSLSDIIKKQNKFNLTLFLENGTFYFNLPRQTTEDCFNVLLLNDKTLLVWSEGYISGFNEGKLIWQITESACINNHYENASGEIFWGLNWGGGLRLYNKVSDIPIGHYKKLLEGNTITSIIEDCDGGYWFAAGRNGVFYCPNPKMDIFNKDTGLPSDNLTSIALKNEFEIYIGFENGGLINFNAKTQKKTTLYHGKVKPYDLVFDSTQNILWVGTLGTVYLQNNSWHSLKIQNPLIKASFSVRHFRFIPSQNELWSTCYYGFSKIDSKSKTATFQSTEIMIDSTPYLIETFDIFTTSTNRTWVANLNGLYELKNKKLYPPEKQVLLFQRRTDAIEELNDSTLVLGSKGHGLVFWKGDNIDSLTEKDGLTSNSVKNMHVDCEGNLWVGTLNGLNKIHWSWNGCYQLETMTTAHGLPSNEIKDITSYNNDIWIATTKGIAHFSSQNFKHATPRPIIILLLSDNRKLDSDSLAQLSYQENNLTIKYFTINYKMNGHITYRYRINRGVWSQTTNTSLNFPSLPPGERVFEVQSQNEDGIWSESSMLSFVINPPWWGTWWARSLMFILTVAFGYRIYVFRIRQLKNAHRIQIQIGELERTALQAQMNPHFIFNCLNSIQNYILQNEKDAAIKYLGSFASLVRSMLNASVVGKISLEEEIKLLNNYLDLEKIRFKNRFSYEVKIEEALDAFETMIPPLLVQPYVENAVKHGISGRETGGKIAVFFEKSDNVLQVSISDNGIGINSDQNILEKQNNHKSFGMSITQNRLELLSNENLNNTVRSESVYNENKQISGTKVVIRIGLTENV